MVWNNIFYHPILGVLPPYFWKHPHGRLWPRSSSFWYKPVAEIWIEPRHNLPLPSGSAAAKIWDKVLRRTVGKLQGDTGGHKVGFCRLASLWFRKAMVKKNDVSHIGVQYFGSSRSTICHSIWSNFGIKIRYHRALGMKKTPENGINPIELNALYKPFGSVNGSEMRRTSWDICIYIWYLIAKMGDSRGLEWFKMDFWTINTGSMVPTIGTYPPCRFPFLLMFTDSSKVSGKGVSRSSWGIIIFIAFQNQQLKPTDPTVYSLVI